MPGFALDAFERQIESFLRARAWRELRFQAGDWPGRGLNSLYDQDFPDLTSRDLFDDLQDASIEDQRQKQSLTALLAAAELEGRTRQFSATLPGAAARATVAFEDEDLAWREAPARWPLVGDVPRRHELAEAWRSAARAELNPLLERWQEALRAELVPFGGEDWLGFWATQRGYDLEQLDRLAHTVLDSSAAVYEHALGVYLGQLDLPLDDVWVADLDWAFRAPRFDLVFSEPARMPLLTRVMRDLGIELEEQTNLVRGTRVRRGVQVLAVDVPNEVHLLQRMGGGYLDYANALLGLGQAQHLVQTERTLPLWQRWLGDETPAQAYGLLLEGLLRDRVWLGERLEYHASDDFRIIAHLGWLVRVRTAAARHLYERQLWQAEPGASLAADYEETMSSALRVRHFGEEYLLELLDAPWSTLRAATTLRAEVFAAQTRQFLKREFDEEWWHSQRAARFIRDELWRQGRRHTAEDLLGFMGLNQDPAAGLDAKVLEFEIAEVLAPL